MVRRAPLVPRHRHRYGRHDPSRVAVNTEFWSGRRVLITGHTGFKGAWLAGLLLEQGAMVSGLALDAGQPGTYADTGLDGRVRSTIGDIRDQKVVRAVLDEQQPEVVLHLAAQALVRRSYTEPVGTFDTNVTGTAVVLHEAATTPSVRVVLVVTSDKVYANDGSGRPFPEDDRLGGGDPYSASKSAAELVVASWQYQLRDIDGPVVVAARAGNVIGGGDHAADRLLPDLFRAVRGGTPLEVRQPDAVRPWQFVLEPVAGYLAYIEAAWADPSAVPPALNLGPGIEACWPVHQVVDAVVGQLGEGTWVHVHPGAAQPEASLLLLDASLAAATIGWRPVLDLHTALAWTAEWARSERAGSSLPDLMTDQINRFQELTAR